MFSFPCPGCGHILRLHQKATVNARYCDACGMRIETDDIERYEADLFRAAEQEVARQEALRREQLAAEREWLDQQERAIAIDREQQSIRDAERRLRAAARNAAFREAMRSIMPALVVISIIAFVFIGSIMSIGIGWTVLFTVILFPLLGLTIAALKSTAERSEESKEELSAVEKDTKRLVICPHCGKRLKINSSLKKRRVYCGACKESFIVGAKGQPFVPDDYDIRKLLAKADKRKLVREASVPPDRPHPNRSKVMHVDTSHGPINIYDDGTSEKIRDGVTYISYEAKEDELRKA